VAGVGQRNAVREIVDVLGRAREVDEFRDARDLRHRGEPLLQPVLDRLDVVVGLPLDRLHARGVRRREIARHGRERLGGGGRERRHLGDGRLGGERLEPRDLDPHTVADEAEFAEVTGERRDLAGVAPVERRQRGEGGELGVGH